MAALLEKDVGVDALKDEMAALLEKDDDALKAAVEPHFAAEAAPTQAEVQNHEAVQARAEEPAEEEDEPAAAAERDEHSLPATESSIATADAAPKSSAADAALEFVKQLPLGVAAVVAGYCAADVCFTLYLALRPPAPVGLPADALAALWDVFVRRYRADRRRLMDEGDLSFDISDSPWPASLGDVDDDPPLVEVAEFEAGEPARNAALLRLHAAALRDLLARLVGPARGDGALLALAPLALFGGGAALDLAVDRASAATTRASFGGVGPWLDDATLGRFLRRARGLRSLDCHSASRLSLRGLRSVAARCGAIEYLCLSHCKEALTDEGALLLARGLARHGNPPKLAHLSLAGATNLSDRGVNDLAKHLRHAPLVDLSLGGCHRLTDKSMAHVALDFIFLKRVNYCAFRGVRSRDTWSVC